MDLGSCGPRFIIVVTGIVVVFVVGVSVIEVVVMVLIVRKE